MTDKLTKLFAQISEIGGHESSRFSAIDPDEIKAFGEAAVLIELRGEEHWLPYSQLRYDDDQLVASNWILDQKGIEL